MNEVNFQISRTQACTAGLWTLALGLYLIGAFMPYGRVLLLLLAAALLVSAFAAAWTVRCFMRSYVSLVRDAFQLGYDKGAADASSVPLQRIH